MSSNSHHRTAAAQSDCGEETLRMIATLPAPHGLEERVHQALRTAPRHGRVLAWPARFSAKMALESNWMRAAAAAAIVFVVVGGGWGVYNRVEMGQSGKVVVMPARVLSAGGFAGAGAIRTPETLPGPQVGNQKTQPATNASKPKKGKSAQPANQAAAQPVAR